MLKYARSKVDYVYGIGLYMTPSDMELRIGEIKDYNNKIVVATNKEKLGVNNSVNNETIPPAKIIQLSGTPTKKSIPEPKIEKLKVIKNIESENNTHKDDKKAIIFGSVVLGFVAILLYKIY